jgi:hypothetical protein
MVYLAIGILFLVSLGLTISSVTSPIKRQKEYETKIQRKYGNAIASRMVSSGISRRKAQKEIEMEILDREIKRRDFTATVDCPKCGFFAVHWILGGRRGRITRQCRECNHEWIQE